MYYNTKYIHKKTTARFSLLLRHPAWKWRGPGLILALHKFVTYLLRHLGCLLEQLEEENWTWNHLPKIPWKANIKWRRRCNVV